MPPATEALSSFSALLYVLVPHPSMTHALGIRIAINDDERPQSQIQIMFEDMMQVKMWREKFENRKLLLPPGTGRKSRSDKIVSARNRTWNLL